MEKLIKYRIRGVAFEWLKSYILRRKQCVRIRKGVDVALSDDADIVLGVPQGSVLSSLWFSLYLDDVTEITAYADDTSLLLSSLRVDDWLQEFDEQWKKKLDGLPRTDSFSISVFSIKIYIYIYIRPSFEIPQIVIKKRNSHKTGWYK